CASGRSCTGRSSSSGSAPDGRSEISEKCPESIASGLFREYRLRLRLGFQVASALKRLNHTAGELVSNTFPPTCPPPAGFCYGHGTRSHPVQHRFYDTPGTGLDG